MVARQLDKRLRDHIASTSSQRGGASGRDGAYGSDGLSSLQRPCKLYISEGIALLLTNRTVLVILDRNVDLIPMLSHSWTYQALVHDVLDMKLNRVTVEVSYITRSSSEADTGAVT
jgi:hypothetical protein